MGDQIERVVLTAEDQTKAAVQSANKNIASVEDAAGRASAAVTKTGAQAGQTVVAITDRTRAQIDRTVAQAESRLNALKTPLEKLDAMKSSALSKVAGDPAAIGRVTAAYEKLIAIEKIQETTAARNEGFQKLSNLIKGGIETPANTAKSAVEGLAEEVGGFGIVAAGAAVGVAALVYEGFELVESAGAQAVALIHLSQRMGISFDDAQNLSAMTKIAGVDIDAFTGLTRKLSETLATGGATTASTVQKFEDLGIRVVESNGQFRSSIDIIRDLSKELNKLPDHASQVKLVADSLGKGALELFPLIKNFGEFEEKAGAVGNALDEGVAKHLEDALQKLDAMGLSWDRLKLKFAEKLVVTVEVVGSFFDKFKRPGAGGIANDGGPIAKMLAEDHAEAQRIANEPTQDVLRGNALVKQFRDRQNNGNLAQKITGLESQRNEVGAHIQLGAGEAIQKAAIANFDALSAKIDRAKEQLKDLAEIPNKEKEARKQLTAAEAEQADGESRLFIQRANTLEQLGVTKKAIGDINAEFAIRISLEQKAETLALNRLRTANAETSLSKDKAAALRGLDPSTLSDVDQRGSLPARRANVDADFEARSLQLHIDTVNQELKFELAKLDVVHDAKLVDDKTYLADKAQKEAIAQLKIDGFRISSSAATDAAILNARDAAQAEAVTKTVELTRQTEEARRQIAVQGLEAERAAKLQALSGIQAVTIQQQIDVETKRAAVTADYESRITDKKIESITAQNDLDLKLLQVLLDAKLITETAYEDERRAIADANQAKIDAARLARDAAVNSAEQQAAQKTADIVRQHNQEVFDSFKQGVRGVLDDVIDKGQNIFKAIGTSIKNAFENEFKDLIASKAAAILTEAVTGTKVAIAGNASQNHGPLGKILGAIGLGGGNKPVFGAKLEAPNHLGDVTLVSGAVPVVLVGASNGPGTQVQKVAQAASPSGGGIGGLLGGLLGLGGASSAAGTAGTGGTAVSSSIDFGQGAQALGTSVNAGTDAVSAGTSSAGGAASSGLGGLFGNLTGPGSLLGKLGALGGGGKAGAGIGGGTGIGGAGGGALLLGGGLLAADGLRRGGLVGLGETALGGAAIGAKFGGPIGALIGGAIGAAAGAIRLFIKGKAEKIVDKVKAVYGVDISKQFAANPLQGIIDQNFGGNIDVGIRSPQVRDMIELYAQSTGQRFPLADKPQAVSLAINGGTLQQVAAQVDGSSIGYGGGSAGLSSPVDQLITGRTAAGPNGASTVVVQSLSLSLNGKSASQALTGQIAKSPDAVGAASIAAGARGTTRRQLAVQQSAPGLLLS